MINNIQSIAFTGKNNIEPKIKKIRKAFDNYFPDLKSPSRMRLFANRDDKFINSKELTDISEKLSFVRYYKKTLYPEGGAAEYFSGLFGIVKAFKVANCDEYAEMLKTILRLNGFKKVDIFELYAQDASKKDAPRRLDHIITAIDVSNKKNQKQSGKLFMPSNFTRILDFWLDDKVRTYKEAKDCYKIFGLKDSDSLLLKPVKSYEPSKDAFDAIIKKFPMLKLNKQKK